ncbi:MAG TPA: ATP-dependent metallopeptidase FtsH/Yme1/Tma family protein, partial [Lachnospiraceae bacterium]|nr:ATP-dependent metallopeptidase FtsH/Yme1/Tma family protein [Lachnospiraceae bacterium]
MRKQMKGLGFYAIILAIIVLAMLLSDSLNKVTTDSYSLKQFTNDLQAKTIDSIDVYPNQEVPTGQVKVSFTNKKSDASFYVSDTSKIEDLADEYDYNAYVHDVDRPSWIMTLLPYLLGFIVIIVLFSFMTSQMSGGGGNSKVMNFGKS